MTTTTVEVHAKSHSIANGQGTGLDTGIAVEPGQVLVVTAKPDDRWRFGQGDRSPNANGLGNPYGVKREPGTISGAAFLGGSLVGSLDGGKSFFGVGTHLTMTVLTKGTLTLYAWDINKGDNSGSITVNITVNSLDSAGVRFQLSGGAIRDYLVKLLTRASEYHRITLKATLTEEQRRETQRVRYGVIESAKLLIDVLASEKGTERDKVRDALRAEAEKMDPNHEVFEDAVLKHVFS